MANDIAKDIAAFYQGGAPTKPKHTDELVRTAKKLQRLQTQRRQIMKRLRQNLADTRRAKQDLKAMCAFVRGEDTL